MEYQKCPVADLCGGCDYQVISYSRQCSIKQERIEELFKNLIKVQPIIKAEDPFNYRNKVQVSFGRDEKGKIIVGNYAKNSHYLIPIDECMICDEKIIGIIRSVRTLINKHHISIYDERAQKGCMRHLLIRSSSLGEYMVVLVTGSPHISREKELVSDIRKYNPDVKTIVHNINRRFTSMILGDRSRVLYGKGYITDELLGCRFRISPSSFYQVNRFQTEKLYSKAIEYADLKGNERVIDAYCGTGTIGILMSRYAKEVIGVEINQEAIRDAGINKRSNGISNISFICDDAGRFMKKAAKNSEHADVVVMDPPRSGASMDFLKSLCILKPDRIVYISYGPDSLRRDVS
ncbi:MAG: 23S rRNA (uracil(1939)-C(5))-methyltransferase RlmD, partial [Erysipelotrichaceae bacterium]|nr:23S rRNA (uracil(1939)-C(5))-methyltransferase RlmD [Erysipelotrichaceae bacterium]